MSLAGSGAVCIWHDIAPEATDEFYQWHNREHMPERVGIPGFLRGRRYIAVAGAPAYFNLYEAESAEVLGGKDYLDRLNAPTEWTRRVVPSFRRVSRSICRVAYSEGVGQGGFMLTQRFELAAAQRAGTLETLRCAAAAAARRAQGHRRRASVPRRRSDQPDRDRGKKSPRRCDRDSRLHRADRGHVGRRRPRCRRVAGGRGARHFSADRAPSIDTSIYQLQHARSKAP